MNVSKVLVVDDSKVVRVVLKRMLEARGLGVDVAASGQEALDYLINHTPDVIFMDFMMEGMDGYAATTRIRANSRTTAIPVVMCTGNDTPQERARARECGASDFVTKPITEVALDGLIGQLRKLVVAPRPPAPIPVAEVAVPVPAEDTVRIAERIAHEIAERLVREAVAALEAASEQTSRSIAQAVATSTTQDALASWRAEVAKNNEGAEQVAKAAAERVAQTFQRQAADDIEAARRSTETVIDAKLVEALTAVSSTAERVARETFDAATAAASEQSRQAAEAARADLQASVRSAAETAAKPIAETAARAVAEEIARTSLVAAREDDATFRSDLEQRAIAAAERVAQSVMQQALDKAEAERASTGAIAEEKLREAVLAAQSTAERVAAKRSTRPRQRSRVRRARLSSRHARNCRRAGGWPPRPRRNRLPRPRHAPWPKRWRAIRSSQPRSTKPRCAANWSNTRSQQRSGWRRPPCNARPTRRKQRIRSPRKSKTRKCARPWPPFNRPPSASHARHSTRPRPRSKRRHVRQSSRRVRICRRAFGSPQKLPRSPLPRQRRGRRSSNSRAKRLPHSLKKKPRLAAGLNRAPSRSRSGSAANWSKWRSAPPRPNSKPRAARWIMRWNRCGPSESNRSN